MERPDCAGFSPLSLCECTFASCVTVVRQLRDQLGHHCGNFGIFIWRFLGFPPARILCWAQLCRHSYCGTQTECFRIQHLDKRDQHNPLSAWLLYQRETSNSTFVKFLFTLRAAEVVKKKEKSKPEGQYTAWRSFKEMMANRNYVLLFTCTNFIYGIMVAFPPMLSNIVAPFNN